MPDTIEPAIQSDLARLAGKYLTFRLAGESYGISVLKVREIVKLLPITRMPQMPHHLKGVVNLRGKIIPVMDLRLRLGLPADEAQEENCIVVVQIMIPGRPAMFVGLIVDAVEEVAHIVAADLESAPEFGAAVDVDSILGMAKLKGAVKTLLDIDRIVAGDSLQPHRASLGF